MSKKSAMEKIKFADILILLLFIVLGFLFLYPFWYLIVVSFNDAYDTMRGDIYFWPRTFSLENYRIVFQNELLLNAYLITIARTILGTVLSVLATGMFAYSLSKKNLLFRKFYTVFAIITMFFSGGLIPTFLLIKALGLYDNFLVYIIPGLINVWNMLLMKSYFMSVPASMEESAKIDGGNDIQIFFRLIIPTTIPIVATIALYNGVAQWNSWFDAYMYIDNQKLLPLQTILMKMIAQSSASQTISQILGSAQEGITITPESLRVTTMVVAIGPIVFIYPFLQKYFAKGIMLGSIKE